MRNGSNQKPGTLPPDLDGIVECAREIAEHRRDILRRMKKALRENNTPNPLQVVPNGEEAISYLAGAGKYADRQAHPFPSLFLLDLEMPVKDGLSVLRWLGSSDDKQGSARRTLSSRPTF